jgi:diguanylate cyclase (GGDEF)-like protein
VLAQGERVGALCLEAREAIDPDAPHFNLERRHMAELVAEYVALAAVNLGLREALKSQAMRDPLTSLYNRRFLEESFTRELNWAKRRHRPVSVIFCDVDHFKRFNDSHGHDAGDALLREMATVIRSVFRGEDIVCRYGGEEFVVLVRDCSLEDTVKRAEQLRGAVRALRVTHQGRALGDVSMSLGVSTFPEHGETSADLLRSADQALFRAKGLGRNQVVVARSATSPLELQPQNDGASFPALVSSVGGQGVSS